METLARLLTDETVWLVIAAVLALAPHIAALTPTPVDDGIVAGARRLLDLIAGNYGKARNAVDKVRTVEEALTRR